LAAGDNPAVIEASWSSDARVAARLKSARRVRDVVAVAIGVRTNGPTPEIAGVGHRTPHCRTLELGSSVAR
jgi:hypothetical protein